MPAKPPLGGRSSEDARPTTGDSLRNHPLLLSTIPLPVNHSIAFAKLDPLDSAQGYQHIELARQRLVQQQDRTTLVVDCLLPHVHISKDEASLWVFCVHGGSDAQACLSERLDSLCLSDLQIKQLDQFSFQDLYPCSERCSFQRDPCHNCLSLPEDPPSTIPLPLYRERSPIDLQMPSRAASPVEGRNPPPSASVRLAPRHPLRTPLNAFLEAVRERVIDDLCQAAAKCEERGFMKRIKTGFLAGCTSIHDKWDDGWEIIDHLTPLVFCHASLNLYQSDILISYNIRKTHLTPLNTRLPLTPGSPLTLLPYATPGYFLSEYRGPTSALIKSFQPHLSGLGAGDWCSVASSASRADSKSHPVFVVVWVAVENMQGEEKGIVAVWPTQLCAFVLPEANRSNSSIESPQFAYGRRMLSPLPELPPALHPSPTPAPAAIAGKHNPSVYNSSKEADSPFLNNESDMKSRIFGNPHEIPQFISVHSSSASDVLLRLRHSTYSPISERDVGNLAPAVATYVDSVAKERERERERFRKERETAQHVPKTPTIRLRNTTEELIKISPVRIAQLGVLKSTNAKDMTDGSSFKAIEDTVSGISLPAYPSPPDDMHGTHDHSKGLPEFPPLEGTEDPGASQPVVSFTPLDDSWLSNSAEFMLDFGMDFGADMHNMAQPHGVHTNTSSDRMNIDMDSFVFTDDDFSFFDNPPPVSNSSFSNSAGLSATDMLSALDVSSVAAPPSAVSTGSANFAFNETTPSPGALWDGTRISHGFDPPSVPFFASYSHTNQMLSERFPSSPTKSKITHSTPASPLEFYSSSLLASESHNSTGSGPEQFDVLRFSQECDVANAKYSNGKFALLSPPADDELDYTNSIMRKLSRGRRPYIMATDPRVAVIKRLANLNAKTAGLLSNTYGFAHGNHDVTSAADQALDSDDSDDDSDDLGSVAVEVRRTCSRQPTPLPSYLPLGPELLASHFAHGAISPLSQSLKPMLAPFEDGYVTSEDAVPTPSSPSATLGWSPEKVLSLESDAQMFFIEIISNPVWVTAWQYGRKDNHRSRATAKSEDPWCTSAMQFIFCCLRFIESMRTTMSMEDYSLVLSPKHAVHDNLRLLDLPDVIVSKANKIVQMSSSALRFWDRLGLAPRSGKKNLIAFVVIHEEDDIIAETSVWLRRISCLYSLKGFGSHESGTNVACLKSGILPVNFTRFKKGITNIMQKIEIGLQPIVFYIVAPTEDHSISSSATRQLFQGMKRAGLPYPMGLVNFVLVPKSVVVAGDNHTAFASLDCLVESVYNRIHRPVDPMRSRAFATFKADASKSFNSPTFVLARSTPSTAVSINDCPQGSGILDGRTILHVGYCLSDCKRWLFGACIDECGEAHDLGTWYFPEDMEDNAVVSRLWTFATEFADHSDSGWRVVFSKLGSLSASELDAWIAYAEVVRNNRNLMSEAEVLITSVELEPWMLDGDDGVRRSPCEIVRGKTCMKREVFSSTSAYIFPLLRCQTSLFRNTLPLTERCVVEEGNTCCHTGLSVMPLKTAVVIHRVQFMESPTSHSEHVRSYHVHLHSRIGSPHSKQTGSNAEILSDICRSFSDLAVLGDERWRLPDSPPLPAHLSAVLFGRSIIAVDNFVEPSDDS